jgi:hypothetical protein
MLRSILTAGVLAVALASSVSAASTAATPDRSGAPAFDRCGTLPPTREEAEAVQARIRSLRGLRARTDFRLTIPVAFHVITCKGAGDVPQSQIDAQIDELNRAYRGTGFSFTLRSVDRTENCNWFTKNTSYGVEKSIKKALAIDVPHTLNVYTVLPGHSLLGWSYLPQSLPEGSYLQGVVIHYASLPGGAAAPFNLGGTLDHEVGHYLGLLHTFENGCVEPGDFIDDTPFEASPAFGCPIGRNTCPQPGDDPIHNYMDYTDDACYTEFTADQTDRMQAVTTAYKPSLFGASPIASGASPEAQLAAPVARGAAGGLGFAGAWPNPFSKQTTLRFTLARGGAVSLALYDVAGQRVATLVNGTLPAGDQSVTLRAGALAPGTYFATLRSAEGVVTRTVVLLP